MNVYLEWNKKSQQITNWGDKYNKNHKVLGK